MLLVLLDVPQNLVPVMPSTRSQNLTNWDAARGFQCPLWYESTLYSSHNFENISQPCRLISSPPPESAYLLLSLRFSHTLLPTLVPSCLSVFVTLDLQSPALHQLPPWSGAWLLQPTLTTFTHILPCLIFFFLVLITDILYTLVIYLIYCLD